LIKRNKLIILVFALLILSLAAVWYFFILNANKSELDERWSANDNNSTQTVDNDIWQGLLDDYLVTDTESGVNLFDYAGLLDDGRQPLDDYVELLVQHNPLKFNRLEQKAYWINLYNSATVRLIIDNYPLVSITKLGEKVTEFGPWNDHAVTVNGIDLSLNDIEHHIIRPLYDDYRIHFAVNCASIGCPNLAANAFNANELDEQLDEASAEFLSHPRGIDLQGESLKLSSLFDWYAKDFGSNLKEVLATLAKHTDEKTSIALAKFSGTPNYEYDWSLNGYCSIDNECGEF